MKQTIVSCSAIFCLAAQYSVLFHETTKGIQIERIENPIFIV